jgi:hypothetical protein
MQLDFILHVVWIAGTRMIQQGIYGLSRGEENGLASCGMALGGIVPLHLSSTARRGIRKTGSVGGRTRGDTGRKLEVLELRGWFTSGHRLGSFGWFPAPVAADAGAAFDQFCNALHKHPSFFHVFAIPLLMTNRCRKQLLKATDVYFVLKAESMIWNNSQHDPLGIFISLPLNRHEPWRLRQTKTVVDLESSLQELPPVLASHGNWKPCQKAWCGSCYTPLEGGRIQGRLPKDEEGNLLVSEEDKFRFGEARPGDHLFYPFKCELCHFRNIQGRSPIMGTGLLCDMELMKCLRRVNLDAFWS